MTKSTKGVSSTKKPKVHKKLVHKAIKKTDLEAFSSGQNVVDQAEDQAAMGSQRMLKMMIEGKKSAKEEVFSRFTEKGEVLSSTDLKTPLLVIFATDLGGDRELIDRESLFKLLEGLMILNLKMVVVDTQQISDLNNLSELPEQNDRKIIWYNPKQDNAGKGREEKEIDRLLLASDMAMLFNRNHDLIGLLMKYGIVVIGDEASPMLENYHPNTERGNSFTYANKDLWSIFAALVRALETYKFPYDWQHIVRKIFK
ncbi:hypothetical protein IT411_04030 [Candidatus Peregrinibacteria bacterium]|nr:hypothetical protein [Candidatus Peregrinibacteria bacterium]